MTDSLVVFDNNGGFSASTSAGVETSRGTYVQDKTTVTTTTTWLASGDIPSGEDLVTTFTLSGTALFSKATFTGYALTYIYDLQED